MRNRVPRCGLVLAVILSVACGGGGGGGGPTTPTPPPPPPPPPAGISFSADGGGTNTIALVAAGNATADSLFLNLDANGVTDLYAVAFDLVITGGVVELVDITEGGFLDQVGAVETSLQMVEDGAGNMVVGLTRLGETGGVDGSGTLLMLEFARVTAGNGSVDFADNSALDSDTAAISGLTWFGGDVGVPAGN